MKLSENMMFPTRNHQAKLKKQLRTYLSLLLMRSRQWSCPLM